jgi:hypothetical protein
MGSSTVDTVGMGPDASLEKLRWSVRLLEHRNRFIVVIGLVAVGSGVLGGIIFHSPSMSLLGFAMILASTADYWLGSKYLVDSIGVHARVGLSLTSMEWKDVKRVIIEASAVKLSPLQEGNPMDPFRGVVLRTNPEVRPSVLSLVRRYSPGEAEFRTSDREFPR